MSRTILIIDDDRELCDLVSELLRGEGFEVKAHHSGAGAVELAASGDYELVILDVMLPEQNGFEILRALRRHSPVPVILLTARGDDVDRIVGLEIGADDYLPKPFNSRELTARIHAVLRRIQPREQSALPRVAVGDVTLDPATRTVRRNDTAIDLTTVEFDLLHTLRRAHPSMSRSMSRRRTAASSYGITVQGFPLTRPSASFCRSTASVSPATAIRAVPGSACRSQLAP